MVDRRRLALLSTVLGVMVLALGLIFSGFHNESTAPTGSTSAPAIVPATGPDDGAGTRPDEAQPKTGAHPPDADGLPDPDGAGDDEDRPSPPTVFFEAAGQARAGDVVQPFMNSAEREWLEEHHYAVYKSDYEFYAGLDDDELRRMADADDLVAMHEWCVRVMYKHKQVEAGVECFTDLASRGSHQAIETLATAFLWGPSNVEVDYVRGQAWARVGYMLGNWKALFFANAAAVEFMSPRELLLADALAASLYAELDRRHRQRTGAPIRADLRPGWLEALEHFAENGLEDEPGDR